MNLHELIYDIKYDKCYLLRKEIKFFLKKMLFAVFLWTKELIIEVFIMFRIMLFRILEIIKKITTIGFLIGIILLIINISECINQNIFVTSARYYKSMLFLFTVHIIVFFSWKISKIGLD